MIKSVRHKQNKLFAAIRKYCDEKDIPHVLNAIESRTSLGFPDLFVIFYIDGITYKTFIEIKRWPDKFRVSQKEWWRKFNLCHGLGFIWLMHPTDDSFLPSTTMNYNHIEYVNNYPSLWRGNTNDIHGFITAIQMQYKKLEDKYDIRKSNTHSNAFRYKAPDD